MHITGNSVGNVASYIGWCGAFPAHFHDGDESAIVESDLESAPEVALRQVLEFVRRRLT